MAAEKKTQFNFSRWPSLRSKRLSYEDVCVLVHDAGPKWKVRRVGVEAVATFMAESAFDPRAYLARVQLPKGEYFLVDDAGVTTFRTPGYEKIRKVHASWPHTLSLASARTRFRKIGCEITSSDRGLVQSNQDYDPVTDRKAFDPVYSVNRGYVIFTNRADTFNAWYANVDGKHERFLVPAGEAWREVFN